MRVIPISEVLTMEDGEIVSSVKGRITAIYDQTAGESDKGPWSFQNLELKDATGAIRVTLKDREPLAKSYKNKEVYISSIKSEKHGFVGVKRKDEDFKGKMRKILWVTPTAEIATEQGDAEGGPAEPPPSDKPPASHTPPAAKAPPVDRAAKQQAAYKAARVFGAKIIVLHDMALAMADVQRKKLEAKWGRVPSEETVRTIASTFFIELKAHVAIDELPTSTPEEPKAKPPEQKPPPREPDPEPEQEPAGEEEEPEVW